MDEKREYIVLQEYEYLLQAALADMNGNLEVFNSKLAEIRQDLSGEYNDNIDTKIRRWIEVTGYLLFRQSKSVEFYIQAKMLYRDGFYEAAIMMARSICEMICYDLLLSIPHQFGTQEEIEKVNFRKLNRHILENKGFPQTTFDLMNDIYDIGNNYIHPKSAQSPKKDALKVLRQLGNIVFSIYGVNDLKSGMTIQTAYLAFPEICDCYHLLIDIFPTPQEALKDAMKYERKKNI